MSTSGFSRRKQDGVLTAPESKLAVSRRGFLKGAGAVAALPLVSPAALAGLKPDEGLKRLGPGEIDLSLNINGEIKKVKAEPRDTLLAVLRTKLDLTGTKEVCDRGACGACTVHIDGRAVNSCLMLAADCVGAKVTTIEGLARGDQLDAVQDQFINHDALQCGFCTPGLIMATRATLNAHDHADEAALRHGCSGNICRCGTYTKVLDAGLAAGGSKMPCGNEADNKGKALENAGTRVDALAKVTGRAKYTADINRPNGAFARFVYCPYGKARLTGADTKAAESVKGVLDVDIKTGKVYTYCGARVGHICADSRNALSDALAALDLKWELLEPTVDPVKAHEAEHGPIPPPLEKAEKSGRRGSDVSKEEVQQAFDNAQHIVERTYTTQIQTHTALEPHGSVVDYRGDNAEIWVSSQSSAMLAPDAARALGISPAKVKSHCEFVGGGFGAKFGIDAEGDLAAKLSKKLNRPVKVINDRKREHLDTGCRPGSIQYMKVALGGDGKPTAGHVHVAGFSGSARGNDATNPARYSLGKIFRSAADIELSTGDARAMRAPGNPQGMFAVDSFVDELAAAAGKDPLEYRKLIETSDVRRRMLDVGAERIGWKTRPNPDGSGKGIVKRGIGVGVADWGNGEGNAQVRIEVFKDGTLRVVCGVQDIGTGTKSVLADVVADHLKIPRKLITADAGNSDYPPGPASGGSTVTRVIVPAIRDAAEKARAELKKRTESEYSDEASWKAACKKIPEENFSVVGSFNKDYWGTGGSESVQFAEVEVDTETGFVRVRRVIALQNCGQAVNRLTAESQIAGGVIQGICFALYEEKIHDPKTGAMLNPNIEFYKLMGTMDCPEIVPMIWKEGQNLGARSLGEPPVVPTAGAVANAISNAIGARVRSLPMTPRKVLAALAERGGI